MLMLSCDCSKNHGTEHGGRVSIAGLTAFNQMYAYPLMLTTAKTCILMKVFKGKHIFAREMLIRTLATTLLVST